MAHRKLEDITSTAACLVFLIFALMGPLLFTMDDHPTEAGVGQVLQDVFDYAVFFSEPVQTRIWRIAVSVSTKETS